MKLRAWGARLAVAVALACPAGAAAAAGPAAEAAPGRLALGWVAGGVTLRVAPARGWEIDLAGGPRDRRVDGESHLIRFANGELIEYREPDHTTRESGWVRLLVARRLLNHERLSFAFAAGASHGWSEGQTRRYYYSLESQLYDTAITDTYEREWSALAAFRPSYRLLPRATAEFYFGFSYRWVENDLDENRREPGREFWQYVRATERTASLATWGGWSGLGSLSLVFWF